MCGLAGYNVSKQWANKYIDKRKMEKVLKEAWFHNIHRGHQAAGFFMVTSDSEKLLTYKAAGQADLLFTEDIEGEEVLEVSIVLGAHTREPSSNSSPLVGANNHPVNFNGVYVTHNGTIYNDSDIISTLRRDQAKELGTVDSAAIAVVLADVTDPLSDIRGIAAALESLEGSFAIHAIWKDHPGVSLLARGSGSPLVVATSKTNHAVFYGSEKSSVWHMINSMGIKAGINNGWSYRSLDMGAFVLLEGGHPVEWGSFDYKSKPSSSSVDHYMARCLPKEGKRDVEVVYLTDNSADYVHEAKHPSLLGHKNKKHEYRRSRKHDIFPVPDNGELKLEAVLCEADYVLVEDGLAHAFFGDVEIVVSQGRVVRDVFNHAIVKNEDRWVKYDKTVEPKPDEPVKDNELPWDEFIRLNGTPIAVLPMNVEPYQFAKDAEKKVATPPIWGQNGKKTTKNMESDSSCPTIRDRKKLIPSKLLSWTNNQYDGSVALQEHTTPHVSHPTLLFIGEGVSECPVHNQQFAKHSMPEDCEVVLMEASYTLAAFSDLTCWYYFGNDLDDHPTIDICLADRDKCMKSGCSWIDKEFVRVFGKISYWEITVAEECWNCGSTRSVQLPEWTKKLEVSNRIDIQDWDAVEGVVVV